MLFIYNYMINDGGGGMCVICIGHIAYRMHESWVFWGSLKAILQCGKINC